MMCRHQNNTIFLMGLDPDYCAHCEVERLTRELAASRKLAQEALSSLGSLEKALAEHIVSRQ